MNEGSDFLFTYGTLMRGFENAFADQLEKSSTFHGKGSFPGLLYKIDWYPGAVYDPHAQENVYGEIYRLSDAASLLPVLDEYEDVFEDANSSLYLRKLIPVVLAGQSILYCWTYLYNQPTAGMQRIAGGDFRQLQ
jgi:gamma-glutamylcyclotransferase (GGCT)/AIG2-like uncharacterized protein YtfP